MSRHSELTIPAPVPFINANDRGHWAARARQVKQWRTMASTVARAEKVPPVEGRVRIVAYVHRDHNRGRWDAGNYHPTAKAAIDGLVDAGVLVDDSTKHVDGPDMRAGEPRPRAELVLTIEETT